MTKLETIKERADKFICREYASKESLNKARRKEFQIIENRKNELIQQIEKLKDEVGLLETLEYKLKWYKR